MHSLHLHSIYLGPLLHNRCHIFLTLYLQLTNFPEGVRNVTNVIEEWAQVDRINAHCVCKVIQIK